MSDPNKKECSYSEKPNNSDTISRQAAIDAINEIINRFERILQGIRESKVDDSVCGMCEYDGAYIGQSGDWCNECPGFEKNNCFKLSGKCRTRWLKELNLPSAQPDYQEVLGWLLAYHTMSFDLHGRYLPHEVISWLINDFTKEFIAERRTDG